mgnify:CR=1 FL=1
MPSPKIALKQLQDNDLLEVVVNMAGQSLNMAMTNAMDSSNFEERWSAD